MLLKDSISRRNNQKKFDVFSYENISEKLRSQFVLLLTDMVGDLHDKGPTVGYSLMEICVRAARHEAGLLELYSVWPYSPDKELYEWIISTKDEEVLIDVIEFILKKSVSIYGQGLRFVRAKITPNIMIEIFNARLLESGLGFQFIDGRLIRVDSNFAHSEIIIPAFEILSDPLFSAADSEFKSSHDHYRHGRHEAAIVECGKALESVLKEIGKIQGWNIQPNDTASKLIAAAFAAKFIPDWMQVEFNALRSLLEAGTPVMRNKLGAHGAGTPREIPARFVAFQLHQTAAAIIFLVDTFKAGTAR